MRRTRHVVLPVRSWEHVGLMVVSLACLTLGLVSRDREGQAGSLAGPDLQHCAPHQVDACPNEDVFTRLLFYDDSAIPSGPIPTDKPEEYRSGQSKNTGTSENREIRSHRNNREGSSTRRASGVRMSRLEAGRSAERRDVRLSERLDERRNRKVRDSRSSERDLIVRNHRGSTERRDMRLAERRNEQRTQVVRMSRTLQQDISSRNSRSVAERTNERRDNGLRYYERDSAGQKSRLTTERREARLAERQNDRRSQMTQGARSPNRDFLSKSSQSPTDRSTERRDSATREWREESRVSGRTSRLVADRRSRERGSALRISRLSSERRDRDSRSGNFLLRDFTVQNLRMISNRREDRLTMSRKPQYVRSLDRDSSAANSRNARSQQRDTMIRNSRDIRSYERDSATRSSQLDAERRNDRLSRSKIVVEERRDVRLSENRDDRRTQRARLTPSINRNSVLRQSKSENDRETERRNARLSVRRDVRRENREDLSHQRNSLARNFRASSFERDSTTSNSRFIAERRDERLTMNREIRDLRSLDRESTSRTPRIVAERRDVRLSERRNDQRTQRTRDTDFSKFRILADRETEHRDARLSVRRDDRRESREVRDARSHQRDMAIRNSRNARSLERYSATRNSRFDTERKEDRLNRKVRDVRSLARDAATRNSRIDAEDRRGIRLSENRENQRRRDARSHQRDFAIRNSRDIKFLERDSSIGNSRLDIGRREDASSQEIRGLRSVARDSVARNSEIGAEERRDVRLSGNRDNRRSAAQIRSSLSFVDRVTERRSSRLSVQRDEKRENREVRDVRSIAVRKALDVRSLERESAIREPRFVAEHRNDRSNRRSRDARDSQSRNPQLAVDRKDSRRSDRRVMLQNRRITTERVENRVNDKFLNSRSLENDRAVRNHRSVAEARLIRSTRSLSYTQERDSAIRTSLINSERVWVNSLRNSRNVRQQIRAVEINNERRSIARHGMKMVRESTAGDRTDRASRLRQTNERRQAKSEDFDRQGERMTRSENVREKDRESRITRSQDVRDYNRYTRATKVPEERKIRQERNYEARYIPANQNMRMMFADILTEQFLPSSSTYQGLRQTAILILCAIYGASLFGGKGSISRNIMSYANRFVIW